MIITISFDSWRSATEMRPVSGLPAAARAAGASMPCASALRSMCSSGAPMRSSTLRSSSTSAPSISQLGLLVELARVLAHDAVEALVQVGERHGAHAHQLLLHLAADARLLQQRGVGLAEVLAAGPAGSSRRRSGSPPSGGSAPEGACSGRTPAGRSRPLLTSITDRRDCIWLSACTSTSRSWLRRRATLSREVGQRLLHARAARPRCASARSPPRPIR